MMLTTTKTTSKTTRKTTTLRWYVVAKKQTTMRKIKVKGPVLCIVCGKELKSIHGEDYEMIHVGIMGHLYAPYGSSHDGDIYQIGICDDCIQQKEKEDKVVLL